MTRLMSWFTSGRRESRAIRVIDHLVKLRNTREAAIQKANLPSILTVGIGLVREVPVQIFKKGWW